MDHEMRPELFDDVLKGIRREKKKRRVRALALSICATIMSCGATAVFFMELRSRLVSSGTVSYISILFSDTSVALNYWDDMAFLIGESLPIVSVILFLTALFALLGSVRYIYTYTHDKRFI